MTDPEMTKLCAEAMGYPLVEVDGLRVWCGINFAHDIFDPLHDDAQAMALVKKFGMNLCKNREETQWYASIRGGSAWDADLNRAIVKCVAKMQSGKALA